uniref:Uncharacterized protein n=1 Tax=mine drainage metagenome TaxID=410659 RepID=E6QSP1_9ZZZZ
MVSGAHGQADNPSLRQSSNVTADWFMV